MIMFNNIYNISNIHKNSYLSKVNINIDQTPSNTNNKKKNEMLDKLNKEHDDFINSIKNDMNKK